MTYCINTVGFLCFVVQVNLLLSVFASELKQSPWVCSEAASFTYFYPAICTTEVNDYDSGVCVIRNMQFYGQRWYEGVSYQIILYV